MRRFVRLLVAFSVCLTAAQPAWAEETNDDEAVAQGVYSKESWPLETVQRPLTLAGGLLEIRGDSFRLGVSGGDVLEVGEPIDLAPDVYYGVSDSFTLGITHTNHPVALGWQPAGLCVSGEEKGCGKLYNAIGVEAQYALTQGGDVGLMAHGGLTLPRFDPDLAMGLTAGMMIRFNGARIAMVVDPNVYIGGIGRDEFIGNDGPSDFLFIPAFFQYQLDTRAMFYLTSGFNSTLSEMGDFFQIPAGVGVNFAVNNRADIGAEFRVENLAGKDIGPEGAQIAKFDERYLIARFAIRL